MHVQAVAHTVYSGLLEQPILAVAQDAQVTLVLSVVDGQVRVPATGSGARTDGNGQGHAVEAGLLARHVVDSG